MSKERNSATATDFRVIVRGLDRIGQIIDVPSESAVRDWIEAGLPVAKVRGRWTGHVGMIADWFKEQIEQRLGA